MKKLLFIPITFLFLASALVQGGIVVRHSDSKNEKTSQHNLDLDSALQAEVSYYHKDRYLYDFVRQELTSYYNRTDFSDPQKQTGWYRVDDFLAWLQTNEAALLEETFVVPQLANFSQSAPEDLRVLWVYLGARYVIDRYKYPVDLNRIFISVCTQNSCSSARQNAIRITAEEKIPVIASDINLGMHEGTHALPFWNKKQTTLSDPLSELSTFYSQFHFGLPVKITDSKDFAAGIRDFLLTYKRTGSKFSLQNEYDFYLLGRVTRLTPKQILAFYDEGGQKLRRNFSLWQNITNLLYIQAKRYLAAEDMKRFPPLSQHIGWQATTDKELIISRTAQFFKVDQELLQNSPLPIVYVGKQSINGSEPVESFIYMYANGAHLRGPFYELSQDTYFKYLLGELAQRPEVLAFYQNMLDNIPPDVKQDILAQYPRMMPEMYGDEGFFHADFSNKIVEKYKDIFIKAAVSALRQAGVAPAPLPEGYI